MGKAPAVIIIARHGARLDAADKHWHLTSPTPYDPPLTYGGWNQSRALGARIGSLLQNREEINPEFSTPNWSKGAESAFGAGYDNEQAEGTRVSRRKHKIVVHTSPFLRCVQSAIAIGAGLNQTPRKAISRSRPSSAKHNLSRSGSPLSRPPNNAENTPPTSSVSASRDQQYESGSRDRIVGNIQPCRLRLDAFLGEWLCPDYFDQITSPPGSVMMLASAKADLLRPAEFIEPPPDAGEKPAPGYFPGGWSNSAAGSSNIDNDSASYFPNMSAMSQALTGQNRSSSADPTLTGSNAPDHMRLSKIKTDVPSEHEGYVPPTPAYAIASSDPIPSGYVLHARDACVEVDYQWDSMREPHNWGNGGEYGEEWSSMHERFQAGIRRMVDWYETSEPPATKDASNEKEKDDDDADTVLVLVTHGAGCNALIGALTGQPVLVDVAMASLTIAVRKDNVGDLFEGNGAERELENEYDVKLVASTEHLRSGGNLSRTPSIQSPRVLASPIPSYRHRFGSTSGTTSPRDSFSLGDSVTRRLSNQKAPNVPSRSASVNRSSPGLWGSVPSSDNNSESADELVPNFGDPTPPPASVSRDRSKARKTTFKPQLPERSASQRSQHGLWGSVAGRGQETGMKRRWTVTDRNA